MKHNIFSIFFKATNSATLNTNDEWHYKFSFTKQINSQLTIECGLTDQIWIGWSHYGTRHANGNKLRDNEELKDLNL